MARTRNTYTWPCAGTVSGSGARLSTVVTGVGGSSVHHSCRSVGCAPSQNRRVRTRAASPSGPVRTATATTPAAPVEPVEVAR